MDWKRYKARQGIDVRSPVWAHLCTGNAAYWSGLYPQSAPPVYWISVEPGDYLVADVKDKPEDLEFVRVLHEDWFTALYEEG